MTEKVYERCVNFVASIVLVLLWKLAAWGLSVSTHWFGSGRSEDYWFMIIVAAYLALRVHKVEMRKK